MTLTRPVLSSGIPTDYYAPDFLLEIEGQELDPATKGDVLEVKVVMDIENMTSAQLTVNNWDDVAFDFKYSDTTTFDVGNRVHVQLGYADRLRSMLRGQISTLSPRFPESGPPSMQVNALDGMLQLRDRKPAEGEEKVYTNVADWQIAQRVAERNGLSVEVTRVGPRHELVVQKNQDDASFLMERAGRIDFDVFITTDQDTGEATLRFMRPTDGRDAEPVQVYELRWGHSLMEFTPVLTLSRQVTSVCVRGWDPRTKSPITATATEADLPSLGGNAVLSGPKAAARVGGAKQDVVIDAPVLSQQEAQELAVSLLTERAYGFVTGSGRMIGLPDLRPGNLMRLLDLGRRFSGDYKVTKVEHTLGASGFFTQFDVSRLYDGGTT